MEKHRTIRRQKLAIFGLLTALIFTLTGFAISAAVVNGPNGSINACYKTTKGNLRTNVAGCKPSETAVVLGGANTVPKSYASTAPFDPDLSDPSDHSVVRVSPVSAGTYVVNGSVTGFAIGTADTIHCRAASSAGGTGPLHDLYIDTNRSGTLPVTARLAVNANGSFTIDCSATFGFADAIDVAITAIKTS